MARSLVIVESPAKARTINRYLGKDFVVKSSVGHIRDLPTGGKASDPKARAKEAAKTRKLSRRRRRRPIARSVPASSSCGAWASIPSTTGRPTYEILPGKEKVVDELRAARREGRHDLPRDRPRPRRRGDRLASARDDRRRSGPLSARRVQRDHAQGDPGGLCATRAIDINRVNAQQARRFLDRVVGFMLSPLLWAKVARGLSAGRVQSVAVRLIVEREREIRAFMPEEYWEAFADLQASGRRRDCSASRCFGTRRKLSARSTPSNRTTRWRACAARRSRVASREDKPTTTRPSAPFITSTLQQAASTRLGVQRQEDHDDGAAALRGRLHHLHAYRLDEPVGDAVACCARVHRQTVRRRVTCRKSRIRYASKAGAQEAHEAIRPSNVNTPPEALAGMEADAVRLYEMIWRQFVACQMPPAEYTSTTVIVQAGDFEARMRGRILRFDGFTRVLPAVARKDEDRTLPDSSRARRSTSRRSSRVQHFTKPPPRYSEASLVRELEKRGIGRPSTYAAIISTIQERGYVTLNGRRFHAEKIGEIVTDRLVEKFDNLMDYGFTAQLERSWTRSPRAKPTGARCSIPFMPTFPASSAAPSRRRRHARRTRRPNTDIPCPVCGRPMQIRTGSTGVFLGCSGYALPPKERCTQTLNLIPGDEVVDVDEDRRPSRGCCGPKAAARAAARRWTATWSTKRASCTSAATIPDCPGFEVEQGEFRIKGYDGPVIDCDKCGAEMQLKSGRFGKYFGCTNTDCKNTRKLLRSGEAAPPKSDPVPMPELRCAKVDDHYVLRDGASGIFLAASQFPKHRETRAPTVAELKPHRAADRSEVSLPAGRAGDGSGRPSGGRASTAARRASSSYRARSTASRRAGERSFRMAAGSRNRASAWSRGPY